MESADILMQLSEVAVAFAGFSGVVAALGSSVVWDERARFRFQNLLLISLGAVFLSLLPLSLSIFEIEYLTIWRVASSAMIVFICAFFVLRAPIAARLSSSDKVTRYVGRSFLVGIASILILQFLEITAIVAPGSGYVAGIVIMLILSALQFAILSLGSIKQRAEE